MMNMIGSVGIFESLFLLQLASYLGSAKVFSQDDDLFLFIPEVHSRCIIQEDTAGL